MNKAEALETIEEYEEDFEAIEGIIADESLTPSQKVAEISEIVQDDEDDGEEEDDDGEDED